MTNIDQFESVFRSAVREPYRYQAMPIDRVLIISDLPEAEAYTYSEQVKGYLHALTSSEDFPAWDAVGPDEFESVTDLLALVGERQPDLLCTYRHLRCEQWQQPYTLGDYVEVLTQATEVPVLVTPHPQAKREAAHALRNTNVVMALTDHLAGDHRLVNYAAAFTERDGVLFLTHIEDDVTFERYIELIGRIPSIDTDDARARIAEQLLKMPADFIESCREELASKSAHIRVEPIVRMGHHLSAYRALIDEHEIDLLVFNTKDEDQLAMHGLAYPLAVEVRNVPLLML